jgi:N-acetylmuramoyl-L-alanine amidase
MVRDVTVTKRLNAMKRVIISVGHDAGARGARNAKGEWENDICRVIAKYATDYLARNGVNVWLVDDLTLPKTIELINRKGHKTDLAIEIHKDSADNFNDAMIRRCGLYHSTYADTSRKIANLIVEKFKQNGANPKTSWVRPDSQSRFKQLAFCNATKMTAFIAEMGFIEGDNSEQECKQYAWILAKSIIQVLGKSIDYQPITE